MNGFVAPRVVATVKWVEHKVGPPENGPRSVTEKGGPKIFTSRMVMEIRNEILSAEKV